MKIHDLLFSADLEVLEDTLKKNPALASVEISLPNNPATAHPLHRVCDGVFSGYYSEATGIQLAKIFLKNGAGLNVQREPGKDSPLTAACSLRCDQLALFYIQQGANVEHK